MTFGYDTKATQRFVETRTVTRTADVGECTRKTFHSASWVLGVGCMGCGLWAVGMCIGVRIKRKQQ